MSRFDPRAFKPGPKRYKRTDPSVLGLFLVVYPTGSKVWYWERQSESRGKLSERIGDFSVVSRSDAQQIANGFNLALAGNIASDRIQEVARASSSFPQIKGVRLSTLWSEFFRRHSKPNKRDWRDDLSKWNTHLSAWQNRPVSSITKTDVAALRDKIGTARANRVTALLSKMFEWGNEVGLIDLPNPCEKVRKIKERSRERFLTAAELRSLAIATAAQPQWFDDYVRLSLLTGQRQGNILTMQKSQIDFDASVWRIPRQKNGTPHMVPLVPEALEIVRRRTESGEWVFPADPSGRKKKTQTITPHATASTVKKRWSKVCKDAGLQDVRMHDLRRTCGSIQAICGVNTSTIGAALGHKSINATAIYARVNVEATRLALTAAADIVSENMKIDRSDSTGDVTPAGEQS